MTIEAQAAAELYIYGYPLVYCTDEILKLTDGRTTLFPRAAPFNTFNGARDLLGPEAEFVSPNNDTLYVVAALDMSGGPLLLHTPDTGDRYYVLQLVDAWSNNFAYVGQRATGTAAADWLLVPAGHDGPIPGGVTPIEVPSTLAVIVGRVQVDGEADLAAVHTVQDQFTLTPAPGTTDGGGAPGYDTTVADDLVFWERFRTYLAAFPPPAADTEFVDIATQAGLTDAATLSDLPSDLISVLKEGEAQGKALVEALAAGGDTPPGAWTSALHLFDYNLDRLGPGTIDTPEWRIDDRRKAYVSRAVAARAGLWGNHGYEADYELVHHDVNGDTLNGAHRYEVTFEPPPPAKAFWSLTMYDTPTYYLVDNPIDRYSIGDRTPGLRYDDDGSITILMQTEAPEGDEAANWLPTPPGDFRPILRMYVPGDSVLDGTYAMPPIRRVD
ncbi:MAG: DUF1254 domain-containing protein [Acidimicrobiales bacterium]|nr:DUF1254 domain-containing protein [Acidimicrobiales bacterium]